MSETPIFNVVYTNKWVHKWREERGIENGDKYECRSLGKTYGDGLLTYPVASFYRKAKTFGRSMELSFVKRN